MPIMPPRLQWFSLEGSGGKKTPLGRSSSLSCASTMPGCTRTQDASGANFEYRVHVPGEVYLYARADRPAVKARAHASGYQRQPCLRGVG